MTVLEDLGWKEYPQRFRMAKGCFYKRFDTPTRCRGNDDKAGIQVCIAVYERGYQIDLQGELPDGTWIKLEQWCMPKDILEGLKLIPRLLETWEFIANKEIK